MCHHESREWGLQPLGRAWKYERAKTVWELVCVQCDQRLLPREVRGACEWQRCGKQWIQELTSLWSMFLSRENTARDLML